ncbi:SPOR domain-containing protein [Marispirochaeta sp.]|jgi:hypothetical protein|uniref:SPOR domain-containing protein n=1 Tax=Marispirochaeta sp. TaxID=2038653 RepID=UPI0029C6F6E5|nr:SPOR domain-containing protein [Marispirochaeta sp.]
MNRTQVTVFIIMMLLAVPLISQSEWEGTTAMGRYGEFPSSGLYGASNSFPRNTLVEVSNLETGLTTTVLIVDRLEDPGLFLLLSRDAAENLGIQDDQIVRSRVRLADNSGRLSITDSDRPYHPDPETNPGSEDELLFLDRYAETPETDSAPTPPVPLAAPLADSEELSQEPEGQPEPETVPQTPPPAVVAEVEAEKEVSPVAPETSELPSEGPIVEELVASAPEDAGMDLPLAEPELKDQTAAVGVSDNLYGAVAPGEEELAVSDLPVPEETEREAAIAEQFPLPQPPYNGEEESFVAAVPSLIEEPEIEEEIAAAPAEEEVPPGETVVVLEPAEPRPPETEPEAEAARPSAVPVAMQTDPESLYLQLGVYTSPVSAETTAARFKGTYPVMVLNQNNAYYKVLVGPLSPDESGALLMNFKAKGFRDAFIRKGY